MRWFSNPEPPQVNLNEPTPTVTRLILGVAA